MFGKNLSAIQARTRLARGTQEIRAHECGTKTSARPTAPSLRIIQGSTALKPARRLVPVARRTQLEAPRRALEGPTCALSRYHASAEINPSESAQGRVRRTDRVHPNGRRQAPRRLPDAT